MIIDDEHRPSLPIATLVVFIACVAGVSLFFWIPLLSYAWHWW